MAWQSDPAHRFPRSRPLTAAATGCLLLTLLLAPACSDDESTTEPPVLTAEALVRQGWSHFELGGGTTALQKFRAALDQEPDHGEAHLGEAWCLLRWAASRQDLQAAVTGFDAAAAQQETTSTTWAGRAAARLGLGGGELAGAVADAGRVLAGDPDFAFAHLAGFDAVDVRLVQAQAEAARGAFAAALAALEPVAACPLQPGDSETWIVGGTRYGSWEGAVLAWLRQIGALAAS